MSLTDEQINAMAAEIAQASQHQSSGTTNVDSSTGQLIPTSATTTNIPQGVIEKSKQALEVNSSHNDFNIFY